MILFWMAKRFTHLAKMLFCLVLGLGYKYTENSSKKLSCVPIRVSKGVFPLALIICWRVEVTIYTKTGHLLKSYQLPKSCSILWSSFEFEFVVFFHAPFSITTDGTSQKTSCSQTQTLIVMIRSHHIREEQTQSHSLLSAACH